MIKKFSRLSAVSRKCDFFSIESFCFTIFCKNSKHRREMEFQVYRLMNFDGQWRNGKVFKKNSHFDCGFSWFTTG
jgi:hypothetical protein